ncbi:response regulator transcription factor [Methylobacter sp. Wu8]|jgi:DNA-binding NarL/FixJ family response regulator|uniref:LuxR family two component transcriptional regulator n=1 Tax=Methylobacter tundripaludum TaxID=173365 RepID=A0A2S6H741_9GAMM|nr:response regulator transcription factor [Methylobacter tundripaludum]MCF7965546.1 response regulator transcription factor [Methylobacter tundripaludum]MCK9636609.1 response regulator transcription factor [Methylobacter tundripaludum]PPK73309.1 LuxR family two component transcriptional regulator [Methylobacter tundripaludum]
MKDKIKVILVDDHAVVRAGFRMLLSTEDDIEVIAEAERGEAACQLYLEQQPDVMVLDLSMPGIGGLESIRRICNRHSNAKILVFSVHDEMVYVDRAMNAGAKGYITKNSAPGILVEAIQKIAAGEIYIEQGLMKNAPLHNSDADDYQTIVDSLSAREFDVFLLLAKGLTAHKIADELCLGYKTVANYGTQIRSKLNVSTAAELAHIAMILGVMKN